MTTTPEQRTQILGLEQLNAMSDKTCAACGRTFNLGDSVVSACGSWDDGPRVIHETDAVFDRLTHTYVERKHFEGLAACRRAVAKT